MVDFSPPPHPPLASTDVLGMFELVASYIVCLCLTKEGFTVTYNVPYRRSGNFRVKNNSRENFSCY